MFGNFDILCIQNVMDAIRLNIRWRYLDIIKHHGGNSAGYSVKIFGDLHLLKCHEYNSTRCSVISTFWNVWITEYSVEWHPWPSNMLRFQNFCNKFEFQNCCYKWQSKQHPDMGVATLSRMLKNTGFFAEYRSLL